MKKGIHPEYKETTVSCACGEVFKTRSTKGDIKLDICSKCHPFFTGKQKLIDSAGRVDRFKRRYAGGKGKKAAPSDAPKAGVQPKARPDAEAKPQAEREGPAAVE